MVTQKRRANLAESPQSIRGSNHDATESHRKGIFQQPPRFGESVFRSEISKANGFHALTVAENEVQGVAEMGHDHSVLVLRSGAEIPVALPYEQLEKKIYEPDFLTDGPVLDLRNVTGLAANAANVNPAAKPSEAHASASEAPANTNQALAPGDKMPDGTVFVGISPDTNKPMYATPADASLTMKFNEAQQYATKLDAHGHKDWRVPTKGELNVLFNNRAAIGGFDISGSNPRGWYWSASSGNTWDAWGQRFSDGLQNTYYKGSHSSVRCVRCVSVRR